MMRDLTATILLACFAAALTFGCGGQEDNTPPNDLPPGTITGREPLVWNQQAADSEELRRYTFALYVDGTAVVLPNASCGALTGTVPSAACTSPLPPLRSGAHTLELVTRLTSTDGVLESARSAPLVVTVAEPGTARATSQAVGAGLEAARQGPQFLVERVVEGVDRASGLAKLPDGRLLVAERARRIRVAEAGALVGQPAVELDDADAGAGWHVSLAPATDFAASRHVYVSYAARDAAGTRVGRVVRFREAAGTLGEPAVVVDALPAEAQAPRVRIGLDGALYVSTAGFEPEASANVGSYSGKILRFTTSGETPDDNPIRFSPVFSLGFRGQVAFDWDRGTGRLWQVESDEGGVWLGWAAPGRKGSRIAYLDGLQASDVAFHVGAAPVAWRGSLFLASPDHECLYRVTGLSSSPPRPAVEQLFAGRFGRIVAVLSADDGLYFATGNGGTDGAGRPTDAVFRVTDSTARVESPPRPAR
jgi:hypothetical protein